jgi:hypothetical protein
LLFVVKERKKQTHLVFASSSSEERKREREREREGQQISKRMKSPNKANHVA